MVMNRREAINTILAAVAAPNLTAAKQLRRIEVATFCESGHRAWKRVRMSELRKGDLFRILKSGRHFGYQECIACSDPWTENGEIGIDAEVCLDVGQSG